MKLLSIVQYLSLFISSSLTSRTKGHPLSTLRTKKDRRSLQTNETMTGAVISSPGFKTCTLEAKLGYPFKDPDEAPYKGFHASWLLVNKVSDDKMALDICDGGYNADVAWCTYNNTGGWGK